ncbi:hypothetical protein E1B28_013739 [Marasmius oreades]|uniref:SAM domain-containing protein n=1 Tax=Marasmius oreades TaxID=181124 RepID=A0A9P7UN33_9AGAR|nr:uncharacterized protein E1B28_013739 [Marasmius oreades]KAG7087798.1 hypothetical protein E1B28_013739 [Marasmius oreades]
MKKHGGIDSPASFSCSSPQSGLDLKINVHDKVFREIGCCMDNRWSKAIPPQEFLDKFLTGSNKRMPSFSTASKQAVKKAITGYVRNTGCKRGHFETTRYQPLITAVAKYCPSIQLEDTSHQSTSISWYEHSVSFQPEIQGYDKTAAFRMTDVTEFLVELEPREEQDPFLEIQDDLSDDYYIDRDTYEAQATRDQISTYAGALMARQFRTHCFSVIIFGHYARLIRWDRAGATVSKLFHVWNETFLVDFLWRYHSADREARGHDPCVVPLNPKTQEREITRVREILEMGKEEFVYMFTIHDETGEKEHRFYGGKMVTTALPTPRGRCTKGFLVTTTEAINRPQPVGSEILKSNIHYLKATWRTLAWDLEPEGKIYASLKDADVPHIPTLLASGDARGRWQNTQTKYMNNHPPIRRHRHYYMAFREVGKSLSKFSNLAEFVGALRDALKAHQTAYEKLHILHRDISDANILIFNGRGLLIDWEFSKVYVPGIPREPRQNERTGTWQFISARMLQLGGQPVQHTLFDDLESFFHVLCWVAIQYSQHGMSDSQVVTFLNDVYDYAVYKNGDDCGGQHKRLAFLVQRFSEKTKFTCLPFRGLVEDLEAVFCYFYKSQRSQDRVSDPRSWTTTDITTWIRKVVHNPDDVAEKIGAYNLTGESFVDLTDHILANSIGITQLSDRHCILRAVEKLKEGETKEEVDQRELAKLDDHTWMLESFTRIADVLSDMPAELIRPGIPPGLQEAVKNAEPEGARKQKKRTQSERAALAQSLTQDAGGQEEMDVDEEDEPEPQQKKQRKSTVPPNRQTQQRQSRSQPGTSRPSRVSDPPQTEVVVRRSARIQQHKDRSRPSGVASTSRGRRSRRLVVRDDA